MISQTSALLIHQTYERTNALENYLEEMIIEIKQLPYDDQKDYWRKLYVIKNYLDSADDCIKQLHSELFNAPSTTQINDYKNTIKKMAGYIQRLGGDPSIINYIKDSDL